MDLNELAINIKALNEKLDKNPNCPFTPEEMASAREFLVFWERMKALGWWGNKLMYLFGLLAVAIINWERITTWFKG